MLKISSFSFGIIVLSSIIILFFEI